MCDDEFISEWNKIIPFKIRQEDFVKPTEDFLCNALVSYLQQMNMDIAPLIAQKNTEDQESRRILKIKLCALINNLYKKSCPTKSFFYYDLIKPSPKKTADLLTYLLNYLHYYIMLKNDVITVAKEKIKERSDIEIRKNTFRNENERNKIRAESIKTKIDEFKSQLPKLVAKIDKHTTDKRNLTEKIKKTQEATKNYENTICQLKHQEAELRNDLVSEDELESLLTVKDSLLNSMSEQEEMEKATVNANQSAAVEIAELQSSLKAAETLMTTYALDDMISASEKKRVVEDLEQKLTHQNASNKKKIVEIKSAERKYDTLKAAVTQTTKDFENQVGDLNNQIINLEADIALKKKEAAELQSKYEMLKSSIEEEENFTELIIKTANEFTQYVRKF